MKFFRPWKTKYTFRLQNTISGGYTKRKLYLLNINFSLTFLKYFCVPRVFMLNKNKQKNAFIYEIIERNNNKNKCNYN